MLILNNILWNIVRNNKQTIVLYCISQLECYIELLIMFCLLDYEIPADSAVYLCIYT